MALESDLRQDLSGSSVHTDKVAIAAMAVMDPWSLVVRTPIKQQM